jgi:hypothetical protein
VNIVEERCGPDGVYMKSADGRECTITRDEIRAYFQAASGDMAKRRDATFQWIKDTLVAALPGSVDFEGVIVNFNTDADGVITQWECIFGT